MAFTEHAPNWMSVACKAVMHWDLTVLILLALDERGWAQNRYKTKAR